MKAPWPLRHQNTLVEIEGSRSAEVTASFLSSRLSNIQVVFFPWIQNWAIFSTILVNLLDKLFRRIEFSNLLLLLLRKYIMFNRAEDLYLGNTATANRRDENRGNGSTYPSAAVSLSSRARANPSSKEKMLNSKFRKIIQHATSQTTP